MPDVSTPEGAARHQRGLTQPRCRFRSSVTAVTEIPSAEPSAEPSAQPRAEAGADIGAQPSPEPVADLGARPASSRALTQPGVPATPSISRSVRITAWLALAAQIGIVITGALVRLTGSGLGCPTWPECMPGSYTPVPHPASKYHASIEFGNRLLTFAVAATAIAALISAVRGLKQHPQKRALRLLAASPLLGTVAQAVVGGLTVLTGLSPWWVAAHFIVSAGIIAATQVYVVRVTSDVGATAELESVAASDVALPGRWLILGASAVLMLGTAVTGAGPHAGDADVTTRLPWHPLLATVLHSSSAWTLVACVVICVRRTTALPHSDARRRVSRRLLVLLLLQAAVGYAQSALDLPAGLVGVHVALAALTWSGAVRLAAISRRHSRHRAMTLTA